MVISDDSEDWKYHKDLIYKDFLIYNIVPKSISYVGPSKWILEKSPFFRTLKLCKIILIYVHMYLYTAYYAYESLSTSETLKSSVTIATCYIEAVTLDYYTVCKYILLLSMQRSFVTYLRLLFFSFPLFLLSIALSLHCACYCQPSLSTAGNRTFPASLFVNETRTWSK